MPLNLLIAHYLPDAVSGAEQSIADLAGRIGPEFQVTMLAPGEGRLAQYYRERGLRVWAKAIPTPRRLLPGWHGLHSALFARRLKQRGLDVVIGNTFSAAGRILDAARRAGLPVGLYVREFISDRPLHRHILDRCDRVFAISKDLQRHLSAMTAPDKVRLTYNYINPEPILARQQAHAGAGKRSLPFDPDHPVIGLVGRLTRFKQPELFIRAAALVIREIPTARFVIAGSAAPGEAEYERELRALASGLGLDDCLAFLGQRSDAIELTSELSIACMTSNREPLGRVILEAHLLGCPVVAPDSGGPAEIILDGETGLLFPSTSADAADQLARHLLRLLRDDSLRARLADNARRHMANTFSGEAHIRIQQEQIAELATLRPRKE